MKPTRTNWSAALRAGAWGNHFIIVPGRRPALRLALAFMLAGGFFAVAQSNNGVPGPTDYARFSQFITARNIFDPNRYAIASGQRTRIQQRTPRYAPSFTLVGTMSYGKGMFAFFDGNQPELRKVLYQSESNSIAGFTVAEITSTNVTLQAADKKQTVPMRIGQTMRQEGASWQPADSGQFVSGTSAGESAAPAAADSSSPDAGATSAPSSALQGNDILKKLMQQREQELK
jgi:hypothetical protein